MPQPSWIWKANRSPVPASTIVRDVVSPRCHQSSNGKNVSQRAQCRSKKWNRRGGEPPIPRKLISFEIDRDSSHCGYLLWVTIVGGPHVEFPEMPDVCGNSFQGLTVDGLVHVPGGFASGVCAARRAVCGIHVGLVDTVTRLSRSSSIGDETTRDCRLSREWLG